MSIASATRSCNSTSRAEGKSRRRKKKRRKERGVRRDREREQERKRTRGTAACLAGRRFFRVRASFETKRLRSARHFPLLWGRGGVSWNNRSVISSLVALISRFFPLQRLIAVVQSVLVNRVTVVWMLQCLMVVGKASCRKRGPVFLFEVSSLSWGT